VYGAYTAAWPLIRTDLQLNYVQVGVLLSLPQILSNIIEPALGILGDSWNRRALIRAGGVAFMGGILLIAASHNYWMLLLVLVVTAPAGGAFVGLAQATLMDVQPERHQHNMARWVLAGSVGVVAGPLVLSAAIATDIGWRGAFVAFAVVSACVLVMIWKAPIASHVTKPDLPIGRALVEGAREALRELRNREVVRWLTMLQFSDLMLDVLLGFLALYFVDVMGMNGATAGLAIVVWTAVGLVGDALLVPLLERIEATRYLRKSALAMLFVLPAFLLFHETIPKLVLAGAMAVLNSGWYSILQGRVYTAMPGKSATAMAVGNVFGIAGGLIPLLLGIIADRFGLTAALWLLISAPIALLAGIPQENGSAKR
jgi:FSR family fosmidomycin resistance protein-like MFS transporter